jgi:hypothetical protein
MPADGRHGWALAKKGASRISAKNVRAFRSMDAFRMTGEVRAPI